MPISPNSPCRVVAAGATQTRPGADGEPACVYPVYRETLARRPSYRVLDQTDDQRGDHFGPVRSSRTAISS